MTRLQPFFIGLWLLVLMAAAAYVRLQGMAAYHFGIDESMIIGISGGASASDVIAFSHYETHPPLFYLLCHYWMLLFPGPDAARGVSMFCGIMLIPLYYAIGRQMRDTMTGICCATLVAFSYGSIVQSSLVRQYTLLMLTLSLAFYFYLRWRGNRSNKALLGYGLGLLLAVLTHFSSVLSLGCFLLIEGFDMWKRRLPLRGYLGWFAVNTLVVVVWTALYVAWLPTIALAKPYILSASGYEMFMALSYPLSAYSYALPCDTAPIAVVFLLLALAFKRKNDADFAFYYRMAWTVLGIGALLIATFIYPYPGTRHSLWTFPFLIPVMGLMLGRGGEWVVQYLAKWKLPGTAMVAVGLLLLTAATYNKAERYHDDMEYGMPMAKWQKIEPYLATLGPNDLIVAQREDAILLINLYPYLSDNPFTGAHKAVLAPYQNTHILFNPYHRRLLTEPELQEMLEEAEKSGYFDGKKRLSFIMTPYFDAPVFNLVRCAQLDNKTITPPDTNLKKVGRDLFFMTVPVQTFQQQVLLPTGKARGCLY